LNNTKPSICSKDTNISKPDTGRRVAHLLKKLVATAHGSLFLVEAENSTYRHFDRSAGRRQAQNPGVFGNFLANNVTAERSEESRFFPWRQQDFSLRSE